METVTKLLSDQGLAISMVVAGLLAVGWIGKRFLGENGVLDKWWSGLFGTDGIVRNVGMRWIALADHLQDSTGSIVAMQQQVVDLQAKHDARATEATRKICDIHAHTGQLIEAGLCACAIIEALETRLPANDRCPEIVAAVARIRELLIKTPGRCQA